MSNGRRRGWFLTAMGILLGILAVSDATKALQHLRDPGRLGMVIFGVRCETFTAT